MGLDGLLEAGGLLDGLYTPRHRFIDGLERLWIDLSVSR